MPAHTCSILQIQIIQMFDVGVCVHIHAQMYRHILPCTTHSFLYTHISTHTHPIHPMCVDILEDTNLRMHSLPPSLTHTHPQTPCLPSCPPSYRINNLCCLRVRLQKCCHHLQPCSVLYCQMQRQPAPLRKSRQQAMSAHYTPSQPATQPQDCVLLPAAPL